MARTKSGWKSTVAFGVCLILAIGLLSGEANADPARANALYLLGYSNYEQGKLKDAANYFFKSYDEEPHSLTAYWLALIYYMVGDARLCQRYASSRSGQD